MLTKIIYHSTKINKTLSLELRTTDVTTHSILSEYERRLEKAVRMEVMDIINEMPADEVERIRTK